MTRGAFVPKYQFLTPEWIEEAKRVRDQFDTDATPPAHSVRMNQVITEVPFGDGDVNVHMDTSSGEVKIDLGHLDDPDLTVTLDYDTAKAIIVDGNPQAGMQACMAGKVKVQGDMTKLMVMSQSTTPGDDSAAKIAAAIQDITE